MVDIKKANMDKERILSTIRLRGPSLPVQIAKSVGTSPLFASAFLSELIGEERLKISDMKVGSSPLYYIPGQEHMLESFVEHLNQKDRQTFNLLKNSKFLLDDEQTPLVRVSLRILKDFAVPVKVKVDGVEKLFWKYFISSDEEFESLVRERFDKDEIKKESEKAAEEVKEKIREAPEEVKGPVKKPRKKKEKKIINEEKIAEAADKIEEKKIEETEFSKNIKNYLVRKDIEILEVFEEKKRDFAARIRIESLFGKQEYYLTAKDKKSISDNDLAIALQNAQAVKMPAIVMGLGELNKKGKDYIVQWNNLVKFERIKF